MCREIDRLIPEADMPQDRLLAIAASLSEALAAADEKGIVHRDLKPAPSSGGAPRAPRPGSGRHVPGAKVSGSIGLIP